MRRDYLRWAWKHTPFFLWIRCAKNTSFPGIKQVSIFKFLNLFFYGIQEGYITTRASAIAFSFFIALFPGIIFLFTLIPYIPIDNFQATLLQEIQELMPSGSFQYVESTLEDLINHKRTSLLSFGLIATLYFTINGVDSTISAFNMSYHSFVIGERGWINQKITSLGLTLLLILLLVGCVTLIVVGESSILKLTSLFSNASEFDYFVIQSTQTILLASLVYFGISFIYFYAPKHRKDWIFFSPGSTIATICVFLLSKGFGLYVTQFDSYNKLYGSIGTLMMIMLWMYFVCIVILVGFELNAAIKGARNHLNRKNEK